MEVAHDYQSFGHRTYCSSYFHSSGEDGAVGCRPVLAALAHPLDAHRDGLHGPTTPTRSRGTAADRCSREQIRLSRTRTRRFVVIVVVAGALDLLVWRIDAHIQRSRTWSLRIRNRLSFFEDPSGGPVWEGTVCRTGKARDRSRSIRLVGLRLRPPEAWPRGGESPRSLVTHASLHRDVALQGT